MEHYKNTNGNSGVTAYEIGEDFIRVKFKDGTVYCYTYGSAGSDKIEEMKKLAIAGSGLNSYINKYVREDYESKE